MDKTLSFGVTPCLPSQCKNHLSSPYVKSLIVILILTASSIIHPARGSNIICSESEYVTSGIEFKQCQDETLQSFQPQSTGARSKYI